MKRLLFLFCITILLSCSGSRKISDSKTEEETLPQLPLSELDIPIKVAAAPVLAKVEKLVPMEFVSDGWPQFMQPSCDFRYKYRFIRTALQITCANSLFNVRFGGNYQVSGSKCLCTAGIPVTPWISGNCGFPPQPLRKVNMSISTNIQFLPQYLIRSTTTINQIQSVDKCAVSVFSNDITQLVSDSIRSSLASFTSSLDQSVAGLNFTKLLTKLKDSSYRKISMGKYGYFLVEPTAVRIGQMNYIKDSFAISVGVSCRPLFTSDPANRIPVPAALPALLQAESRHGVRLYMNMNYDYHFLSKILHDSLYNKVFDLKGRTIVIKDASIRCIGNHQIELRIDFAGSNHGSVFLRGTPALDTARQTMSIPDIQYSMEGEDLALKVAKSLFRNKIRKTIQGKSYLDITAFTGANKIIIDEQLNREWSPGVYSSGSLQEAKIIGLLVTQQNIQLQVFIAGELKILVGNL